MTNPGLDLSDSRNLAFSEDQVRAALERMIAHPAFGAHEQRIEFPRFVGDDGIVPQRTRRQGIYDRADGLRP